MKFGRGDRAKFLLLVIFMSLIWFLGRHFNLSAEKFQEGLEKFPVFYSGAIFIILYVFFTFFIWLSKDVFRFSAAFLFGAYLSTLFVLVAEIINAFVLFHISRYMGREFIAAYLEGKYRGLDEKLGRIDFLSLFVLRAVPLIPFRFLDLASGLTGISFRRYFLAAVFGSVLRIFWLQYILAGVGREAFSRPYAVVEYFLRHKGIFAFSFIYLILVVFLGVKMKKEGSVR